MVEVGWITFHRWFFDSEQAAGALTLPAPEGAAWWHFGPDSPIGPDGLRTGRGRSWAGAGFFADLDRGGSRAGRACGAVSGPSGTW